MIRNWGPTEQNFRITDKWNLVPPFFPTPLPCLFSHQHVVHDSCILKSPVAHWHRIVEAVCSRFRGIQFRWNSNRNLGACRKWKRNAEKWRAWLSGGSCTYTSFSAGRPSHRHICLRILMENSGMMTCNCFI